MNIFYQVGLFFTFCTFLVFFMTSLGEGLLIALLFLGIAITCLIVLSKASTK